MTGRWISMGLLLTLPLLAHHSIKAEFDVDRTVTIQGVVTSVDWVNPHVEIYVGITGMNDKVVDWKVESLPPNTLRRIGWPRDSFKTGDRITIVGFPVRNGTRLVSATKITTADGKELNTPGPSDGKGWTMAVDERYPK